VAGEGCVQAAFPADSLQGLAEATTALGRTHRSASVPVLVDALNPYHWRSSRSAVIGLRAQGRGALCAAPAVAGWRKLCLDHGVTADQQDGINDTLHQLSRLRADLDEADPAAPAGSLERIRRFFDEVFQPYILTLLVPPVQYWHRGVIGYLETLNGDLETTAGALYNFAVTLREHTWGSGTNSGWDEYTHSETLALTGKLGPLVDRLRVEREWLTQSAAEPPAAAPPKADPSSLPEQSIAWATEELAAPSVSRRLLACRLLRQFGSEAHTAVPSLQGMLAQLDGAAPAAINELREEALTTLCEIHPFPDPATAPARTDPVHRRAHADQPPAPTVDQGSAGDLLLAIAAADTDPSVRTAAILAIADAGAPIRGALAVAFSAATSDDPAERAAATRLLALFAR